MNIYVYVCMCECKGEEKEYEEIFIPQNLITLLLSIIRVSIH